METAILAGGCFWCTEAIFKRLKGVKEVISGYSGGKLNNPSYEQVSLGSTNHTEAIKIEFDPSVVSYETLLEVFFRLHDPTTLNQQGADVGTQYRSAIFYTNETQKNIAEKLKSKIKNAVTEISKFEEFFPAEGYHQNYYEQNKNAVYCKVVIDPKIKKLYKEFGNITNEK